MNVLRKLFFLAMLLFSVIGPACANAGDSLDVVITQNADYLMPGEHFEFSILSRCEVERRINYVLIGDEKVKWKMGEIITHGFEAAAEPGVYEIPVKIIFTNGKNQVRSQSRTVTYTIGQPTFGIGLDRMNILYIGVDNPLSLATSYGGADKATISIAGGGGSVIMVGAGKYIVHVKSLTDECRISISVDDKLIGVSQFRVRNLPVPVGIVGGHTSGDSISAGAFKAQEGVLASLDGFGFELRYEVLGYTVNIMTAKGEVKSADCTSAYFSPAVKGLFTQHLQPGCTVIIGNLFAKGPDGRAMKLLPVVYQIK